MSIKIKLNNDWVDTNIKAVRGVNHVNSEDVYTKEETEKKFATKTEVQTQINNSITKENIENIIGEVYTKTESDVLFSDKVSKSDIVQSTGESTTSVMSQNAVSDAIKKKLNITDFNTFKADNTKTLNALDRNVSQNGSEIQEVNGIVQNHTDAIATLNTSIAQKADKTELATINANVDKKVSKTDIVQNTGQSTTSVMSQKASTDSFIANTPSGDPMHNMYVAMGAVWNGSGVDRTYPTPWADYAEDEEDKVYVHKNGCWAYCYVGDLTSKDMADIAILPKIYHAFPPFFASGFKGRAYASNISPATASNVKGYSKEFASGFQTFFQNYKNEVIVLHDNPFSTNYVFDDNLYTFNNTGLRCILGLMQLNGETINVFTGSKSLKFVFLYKLGINVSFKDCPKLSKHCVRYMIENATDATITITLHPEAYERAIADDGVQAALANKTNVSLAKAE